MKKATAILIAAFLHASAGQVAVDLDPVPQKTSEWLQYDDGSAYWASWNGVYRGTWFNVQDFFPWAVSYPIGISEIWFYHSSIYPWDTSDVYIEIWNGGSAGPVSRLDKTEVTAVCYGPVFAKYPLSLAGDQNFWALANTQMSSGGWPSSLSDGTPGTHSFFSDDFILWEPWGDTGDFFIRVGQTWALTNTTWGSVKAAFN